MFGYQGVTLVHFRFPIQRNVSVLLAKANTDYFVIYTEKPKVFMNFNSNGKTSGHYLPLQS